MKGELLCCVGCPQPLKHTISILYMLSAANFSLQASGWWMSNMSTRLTGNPGRYQKANALLSLINPIGPKAVFEQLNSQSTYQKSLIHYRALGQVNRIPNFLFVYVGARFQLSCLSFANGIRCPFAFKGGGKRWPPESRKMNWDKLGFSASDATDAPEGVMCEDSWQGQMGADSQQ